MGGAAGFGVALAAGEALAGAGLAGAALPAAAGFLGARAPAAGAGLSPGAARPGAGAAGCAGAGAPAAGFGLSPAAPGSAKVAPPPLQRIRSPRNSTGALSRFLLPGRETTMVGAMIGCSLASNRPTRPPG